MESQQEGHEKGEKCNRNGCNGTIQEKEKEGCCSCHINPPCSYCEYDPNFCPECNWDAEEEKYEIIAKRSAEYKNHERVDYSKLYLQHKEEFFEMYHGKKKADKLHIIRNTHTHFTMEVMCVFPKGTETLESLLPQIKGTFGGRLISKTETTLKYIAYTD